NSASPSFCTSLERRSAACSCLPKGVFPLPSAPWQSTHLVRKTLAPGDFAACCPTRDETTTNERIMSQPTNLPDFAFTRSTSKRDALIEHAGMGQQVLQMIYESFAILRLSLRYNAFRLLCRPGLIFMSDM